MLACPKVNEMSEWSVIRPAYSVMEKFKRGESGSSSGKKRRIKSQAHLLFCMKEFMHFNIVHKQYSWQKILAKSARCTWWISSTGRHVRSPASCNITNVLLVWSFLMSRNVLLTSDSAEEIKAKMLPQGGQRGGYSILDFQIWWWTSPTWSTKIRVRWKWESEMEKIVSSGAVNCLSVWHQKGMREELEDKVELNLHSSSRLRS